MTIAIVGAGAAGIAAASRLGELGQACIVLEAGASAGGRCITDTATFGVPLDLGAHWLHSPARNPMVAAADRFGIRYRAGVQDQRYAGDGGWLADGDARACDDYVAACLERVAGAGRDGFDGPVTDLFAGQEQERWHGAFLAGIEAKQGVPAARCSTLDFARYVWEGDDWPVTGGFGTILARLAEGLPVRTATPVNAIHWSEGDSVRLETPRGTLEAAAVIVTASTGALAATIRFRPDLPDWKAKAIHDLPMGSCNKIMLAFTRPVFADCDASLVLPAGTAPEPAEFMLREGGAESATCLFNGELGRGLGAAGERAMADHAIEHLAGLFGTDIRKALAPRRIIANWDAEPFIRGCYAAAKPGRAAARADLARPLGERLFFAGEATSPDYMGDVHGAWFSGIAAAEAAVAALSRSTSGR